MFNHDHFSHDRTGVLLPSCGENNVCGFMSGIWKKLLHENIAVYSNRKVFSSTFKLGTCTGDFFIA